MKKRIIISLLVILFVVAASLGSTMAWFTDSVELENTFTAGTLSILAEDEWNVNTWNMTESDVWDNANPGECQEKDFTITNDGSKKLYLRLELNGSWEDNIPNPQGVDVPADAPNDDLVTIEPSEAFEADWTYLDGYWYYNDVIEPTGDGDPLTFTFKVCLAGLGTGNYYQGADYNLTFGLEAVQATHAASFDLWSAGLYISDPAWFEVTVSGNDYIMDAGSVDMTWAPTDAGEPNYLGW